MDYLSVAAGFVLLLVSGEYLVSGAVASARHLGVSPLVIGLTIVAYGTSAPELLVSLDAHLTGASGIAIGNVVGSNIANVLLILGAAALIYPITSAPGSFHRNLRIMVGAIMLLVVLGLLGEIAPWAGGLMLLILVTFTTFAYRAEQQAQDEAAAANPQDPDGGGAKSLRLALLIVLAGTIGVVAGAHFLVEGAASLARRFGVSEATIGLTLVALGTSLPELATAMIAARRRHSDVALGNVVGSNIFNTLGIAGVVPLFGSLPVPAKFALFDLWVMLGATLAFAILMATRYRLGRAAGLVFLLTYAAYIAAQHEGAAGLVLTGG